MEAENIHIDKNFVIIDELEKKNIISEILKDKGIDKIKSISGKISEYISAINNHIEKYLYLEVSEELVKEVNKEYLRIKQDNNLFDFDDLIVETLRMFKNNKNILEKYQSKFQFILVDEFQDTNINQYELLKLLSKVHRNITVVGDEDQAIYSWRGGDIENFFRFKNDFPDAKILKLEQNYRSTKNILKIANAVILNNRFRDNKILWTENEEGEEVKLFNFLTPIEEAEFIAEKINEYVKEDKYNFSDFAIFIRTNYYASNFEFALRERDIPYKIFGGIKFFDRKEIRDIVAYLKFINNKRDSFSLKRIINIPRRGIGVTTLNNVIEYAKSKNISLWEALKNFKYNNNINKFITLIERLDDKLKELKLNEFLNFLLEEIEYKEYLKIYNDYTYRLLNINTLEEDMNDFINKYPDSDLTDYITHISLYTVQDEYKEEEHNYVSIMTLHNAKGLEFNVVFIAGLVEGMFPHIKVINDSSFQEEKMEEERRLFYVGVTRAKKELILTYPSTILQWGKSKVEDVSRFIRELSYNLY